MNTIHSRIKDRRQALGFETQEALGKAIGVSWQTVQQWENGATAPNRNRITKVAEVLQTTTEWLLHGIGEPGATGASHATPKMKAPEWCAQDAFELLELYYGRDREGRDQIMRFAQSLADGEISDVASNNG